MEIRGKVVIVTGGASGLGAAAVRHLAAQGALPLIADLAVERAEALQAELQAAGLRALFERCDVTSAAQAQAVTTAAQAAGELRALVNCAGIAPAERTVGRDGPHRLESFALAVNVNLVGSFNMLRLAAAAMAAMPPLADGERGVIVNTASVAAFDGQIGQAAYAASKAGLVGLTLPVARDLARHGIRVMTVAPGVFATPMLTALPADVQEALGRQVPFPPRLGRPEEYAQLVAAILANPMLNGETIRLDGALRMPPQ